MNVYTIMQAVPVLPVNSIFAMQKAIILYQYFYNSNKCIFETTEKHHWLFLFVLFITLGVGGRGM